MSRGAGIDIEIFGMGKQRVVLLVAGIKGLWGFSESSSPSKAFVSFAETRDKKEIRKMLYF